jgi:hypothetical protein
LWHCHALSCRTIKNKQARKTMKRGILLIAAALSTSVCAQGGPTLELGLGHAWVSGSRTYGMGMYGETIGRTEAASIPSATLWFKRADSFSVGVSYAYLGTMNTDRLTGFSGATPCYECIHVPPRLPYRIEEQIHQVSLIPAWTMKPADNLAVTAGLSLDLFYSKPKLKSVYSVYPVDISSEKDLRLGTYLAAYRQITVQSSVGVFHRYAAPSGRSINTLGLTLRHDF